ncbi:hypothetical protein [Atlantibacter hermannii]|uniref:hypothetical protein n=1 Tax=Atlantibacter hermannii TaxID=565 RepID=UPI0013EF13E0|nr:hypothetical protein [Atlantibacter hermannii]
MEMLCVNLNRFYNDADVFEILEEDLKSKVVDFIIINGDRDVYNEMACFLISPKIYVGFSPLNKSDLNGLCLLLSHLNGSSGYNLNFYEEDNIQTKGQNPLAASFIDYLESKDIESVMYNTREIQKNISLYYSSIPSIEKTLRPYIDYNIVIFSLYKTSIGICRYNEMEKDLYRSLRNATISNRLNVALCDAYKNCPDLFDIVKCIENYIIMVKTNNIDALTFYVALFLNLSLFNKNRNEYSIAYLYLQRAVETALIYHFLDNDIIEVNDYGGLSFKGDVNEIHGVGELIKEFFARSKDNDLSKKIWKLNSLRNKMLLAHGYYTPSGVDYDDLYCAVKEFVLNIISSEEPKAFYEKILNGLKPIGKEKIKKELSFALLNN